MRTPRPLAAALVLPILLASCGKGEEAVQAPAVEPKYVKTARIEAGVFSENSKLLGKIAARKETAVSAQVSGVIRTISVSVGERVRAGQVLATVDFSTNPLLATFTSASNAYSNAEASYQLTRESVEKDLENAKIALENAKTARDNVYASTEKQLKLAESQLDAVKTQEANAEKTSGISVELAKKARDNAKLTLENFEANSVASLKSLRDRKAWLESQAVTTVTSALVTVDSALTHADTVLGITERNRTGNDSYETYLGAKDSTTKTRAENAFGIAKKKYDDLSASDWKTGADAGKNLADARSMAEAAAELSSALVATLDASIVAGQLPQATLDAMKTVAATKQSAVLGTLSSLVSLQNSLDDVTNSLASTETQISTNRASYETALGIAETNLANAEAGRVSSLDGISGSRTVTANQVESAVVSARSARDAADNAVRAAETAYESARAKLQAQLTSVKSQLDGTKGQRDLAKIQFDNGQIKAPFDGVILSKNVEIGSLVAPGTPTFSLGDDSGRIVRLEVDSDTVSGISIGTVVRLEKDSVSLTGSVSLLSPSADPQSRMFRVEADIEDVDAAKKLWNLGDFADAYLTRKRGDVPSLAVPFSALVAAPTQGEFLVYVVDSEGRAKSRPVKIGRKNGEGVEILSGLSEGDRVVTDGALKLADADVVEER